MSLLFYHIGRLIGKEAMLLVIRVFFLLFLLQFMEGYNVGPVAHPGFHRGRGNKNEQGTCCMSLKGVYGEFVLMQV